MHTATRKARIMLTEFLSDPYLLAIGLAFVAKLAVDVLF